MPIYARSRKPFSSTLFRNPTADYRGAPFWSWNNTLHLPQLLTQLGYLKQMGFGGAHLHCRTGLGTPYMSKEFLQIVKATADHAKSLGLLTWLYDEDRWPSGFAGGLVTKDPQFRAKYLLFTPKPYNPDLQSQSLNISNSVGARAQNGALLARYEITLDNGFLATYRRLPASETPSPSSNIWYAYLETATPISWFNHQTYVDTLNPKAIQRFIQTTHEPYKKILGKEFGKSVPAIFTDEPQFSRKTLLTSPDDRTDVILPWTTDLPHSYRKTHNADILDTLPEILWQLPHNAPSQHRYRYHDHVAERFASAYADTLGNWCSKSNIALTGHMMDEPSLESQTNALGEAMRSYRAFHIPGIDILCDHMELTTAKQAQSAAHQFGAPGVMSELYGVTGWHFDFTGHKRQGDWQAALGITLRVPHLAWVSMAGEAKRDYPAAIGHQSPWFTQYPVIENHFARTNVALTRGKPLVRIAVVHPIESFWLNFGPSSQTHLLRQQLETQFASLTNWLLFGSCDFNFIAESLLPLQHKSSTVPQLVVGQMAYDVVLLPALQTIRSSTLDALEAFANRGGKILFLGQIPTLVDALPCSRPAQLSARCTQIPFEKPLILRALAPYLDVQIHCAQRNSWQHAPLDSASFLYQLRDDAPNRFLFICNTDRDRPRNQTTISLKGHFKLTLLSTDTGSSAPLAATYSSTHTSFTWDAPAAGSILLQLTPGKQPASKSAVSLREPAFTEIARLHAPATGIPVSLSEPNVLILDQPEWRLNSGPWQPPEEILRLDDTVRKTLKIPLREGNMAQPWVDQSPDPVLATLELRFTITSSVPVQNPLLALEDASATTILFNAQPVPNSPTGWWVDEAIQTVPLPSFPPGTHELLLQIPFSRKRNVENAFLLGNFGVTLRGRSARLTRKVTRLHLGDFTSQGLPFYAGNVTYHFHLPTLASPTTLEAAHFAGPLLTAHVDNSPTGNLALPPFRMQLPPQAKKLDLTRFGNRANTFGPLHLNDKFLTWFGPNAYRSTGPRFTYEYQLRPMGLLSAPRLLSPT